MQFVYSRMAWSHLPQLSESEEEVRGYCCIALRAPQICINIGSVLRAADCFGASAVFTDNKIYKKCATDTTKAYRRIPLIQGVDIMQSIPYDCQPVAVEFVERSECLSTFQHPQRAYYIFGPENGTLSKDIMRQCTTVIKIPTSACLNLAAAVNIVLYDRVSKAITKPLHGGMWVSKLIHAKTV